MWSRLSHENALPHSDHLKTFISYPHKCTTRHQLCNSFLYRRIPDLTTPPPLRPLRETQKCFETSISPMPITPPRTFFKLILRYHFFLIKTLKLRGGVTGFGDTFISKTCLFFLGSHVRGRGGGGRYIWYSMVHGLEIISNSTSI